MEKNNYNSALKLLWNPFTVTGLAHELYLSYEKETPKSLLAEGDRLEKEMDDLHEFTFFSKAFPTVSVKFKGWPTMLGMILVYAKKWELSNSLLIKNCELI